MQKNKMVNLINNFKLVAKSRGIQEAQKWAERWIAKNPNEVIACAELKKAEQNLVNKEAKKKFKKINKSFLAQMRNIEKLRKLGAL